LTVEFGNTEPGGDPIIVEDWFRASREPVFRDSTDLDRVVN